MFQAGSIRKIEVKDFVTYSYAELYPGPNLNMLVGPNGSGKSTMVAALILGLGGNPRVVGRGHKISEYIKHNCDQALINIFLQGNDENNFIKITRNFNKEDKSKWSINNRASTNKEVKELIETFNIQVDNLCQFLPQDRVQEFAKLDQQKLLREVQVALCRNDLIEKQEGLIECRENHLQLLKAIETNSTKLTELREANLRLEGKIANFNKKKDYLSEVQDIDRKIAWLQYDAFYEKLQEIRADLAKAQKVYEKYKSDLKPSTKMINDMKAEVVELQKRNTNIARSINDAENAIKSNIASVDKAKLSINRVNNEMLTKIGELEQKRREIEQSSEKIEQMRNLQKECIANIGNDKDVRLQTQRLTDEVQKLKRHCGKLDEKRDEIIRLKQNKSSEVRALDYEISRLENVQQQRLQQLRHLDSDAYEAVLWLRQNKHLFKGEVFEPIMMEVNVLDPKSAHYVENVIGFRDKIAFGCTLREDMNTFIRQLRSEKKLTVNVFHAGDRESSARFQPSVPIERLRKYGLYTYLRSLFTAPEPIMNYLCKNYRVHNIPVGNSQTNQYYQQIPDHIRVFFSDNYRYSVNVSKYSGEKSIKQTDIKGDGSLSISLDILRLENLKGQIGDMRQSIVDCDEQLRELDNQVQLINGKVAELGGQLKKIHSAKQQAAQIEARINTMLKRVDEMKSEITDSEGIRNQAKRRIQKIIRDQRTNQYEMKTNYKSLTYLITKQNLTLVKIENTRQRIAYLENKVQDTRRLMEEAEATYAQVKEVHIDIKSQAKLALQKAKGLSKNFTPDDEGFDEFRATFDKLSSNLQKLEDKKSQINAMIDCLNTADDDELHQYEERVASIAELENKIAKANKELSKIIAKMDNLEKEWLEPLSELIAEINLKFASAFELMGCAGEVDLSHGENSDKDYANYGLRIKVTYRNGEPLQELNNVVQSGGERAVATAVFMLALQELTPVPFRCVDEINQGMDGENERRIMNLLIESTNSANTPQYFLITPKLVPNLTYSDSMMVHFVHNGLFVEPNSEWSASKLCNPQGIQIH